MNYQPPLRPEDDHFPHTPRPRTPIGLSDDGFRATLDGLLGQVDALPPAQREPLQAAADATRQRQDQLRKTVERLQETLDFLRLSIKYLAFDLEATRRENAYLRKLVEEGKGAD